jgi:hypothetical protein
VYIDIDPNDNVSEATMATFKEVAPSVPVRAIQIELSDGKVEWCAVVGWGEAGPVPALLTPIEESGDGPARLLHGGEHGLRLARLTSPEAAASVTWSLDDTQQWGEGFVICTPEAQFRV